MNDAALLQAYARDRSEPAFREIVARYVALVYSAARRQVGEPALAEDVTQVVFTILAKKVDQLPEGTLLTGWLYRTTRHTAAKALRNEQRRRRREQEAVQMQIPDSDTRWKELAPFLDEAMARLGEVDRNAVLLRYFQNRSLREVGRALGMSEDTAQKRVSRAVDKLRRLFWKRGVAVSGIALTGMLGTHAAQFAPDHVVALVLTAASHQAAATSVSTLLHQALPGAIRQPIGPKLIAAGWAAAAIVATTFLFWRLWPEPKPSASDWSFDRQIVAHQRPPVRVTLPPVAPVESAKTVIRPPAASNATLAQSSATASTAVPRREAGISNALPTTIAALKPATRTDTALPSAPQMPAQLPAQVSPSWAGPAFGGTYPVTYNVRWMTVPGPMFVTNLPRRLPVQTPAAPPRPAINRRITGPVRQ